MLNAKNFGIALGTLWAACLFICTIVAMNGSYGHEFLNFVATFYPGFEISFGGAVLGAVYAFFDGFIGGYIFVWIYNKLQK